MTDNSSALSAHEQDHTNLANAIAAHLPLKARLGSLPRKFVQDRLDRLTYGSLTLEDSQGKFQFGSRQSEELAGSIRVKSPRFYRRVLFGGVLGAAESYIRGEWSTGDLAATLQVLARNAEVMRRVNRSAAGLLQPLHRGLQWLNRNSKAGSRRNIAAHYDLSNEFFGLWLDDTMTYSSGIYENELTTLRDASIAKFDRICRKLQLKPEDHVLEIGSGWGGFAIYAASKFGCRVTTTTISQQQYDLARQRIKAAGLSDRITLLLKDYRDLTGTYNKLVSIEMVEAVGHQYLPTYFGKCAALLAEDGMMCLQAITIPDQRYDNYRRSIDFIQRYIFPGGCLPCTASIGRSLQTTDFRMLHWEDFGTDYAKTLAHWRSNFWQQIDRVRALGYSEEFIRMWDFYFCYCEAGFRERQIGLSQILLTKPMCRRESLS